MRKILGATLAVLIVGLLTSCGVPTGGAVGFTVDAAGRPVLLIQMCEGQVDGATVYFSSDDEAPSESGTSTELGRWESATAVTDFARVTLAQPGPGWRTLQALRPLDAGVTYSAYGWSTDNRWSAAHFDFTTGDLAKLAPGSVLYPAFDDGGTSKTGSVSDFRKETCEQDWGS
jgi:hypothetical protein